MKRDVYQIITDRIVRLLQAGTVPWHRPWKGKDQAPRNFITRKVYRGINLFLLHASGFASPYWLTFKQVQSLGGRVKKGEESFPVVFWKIFEEDANGETKKIPFLRYYSVFNVAQCEGIESPTTLGAVPKFQSIEICERTVANMPNRPPIEHGVAQAYYLPRHDKVHMPDQTAFECPEAYYGTIFHELTHATGHQSRLARKEVVEMSKFGSDPYSREELVAEMGSAFLCGHCGIENTTITRSASYIQSWLGRLLKDRKMVVQAAAQAQTSTDFILDVRQAEHEGPIEYQPKEWKVVALRECPIPEHMYLCDTPQAAADYWRTVVEKADYFNPEVECFVAVHLNTRRRIKGHHLVSLGTQDCVFSHPREVFRTALLGAANAIILMHNHPSGESSPSDADIKVTRDLIRAGQLLKIEVLDHIIIGKPEHCSLKQMGHFYS